ncbi:MAG: hypothetical protein Q9216_003859 [Gyalolechia sp. 2 TL-2023]
MASTSSPPHPGFRRLSGSQEPSTDNTYPCSEDPRIFQSPPRMSRSPQIASKAYTDQFQKTLFDQRKAFDSERAMWDIERADLMETIAALQTSLRQYQPSRFDSSRLGSYPGASGGRQATSSSGNEIWRGTGGKSAAQSTRYLPGSDTHHAFPSTAENLPPGRSLSENITRSALVHRPSSLGPDAQKHFDGITFKSPPTTIQGGLGSRASATSTHPLSSSHSSSRESPRGLKLPSVEEEPDNLTRHAGHTPLARTVPGLDGTTSAIDSDLPTPLHTEQERPPIEPRASIAKIPSERSDSYFPEPADEFDQDPELQGQLSLKNNASDDSRFLSELNSKLAQAAESSTSASSHQATKPKESFAHEDEIFDQPEPEPRLRIKRSLNFGSQLGGNFGPQP